MNLDSNMHVTVFFLFFSLLFSFLSSALLSKKPNLLPDRPNYRSSHSRTVSRGGGLTFLIPVLIFLAVKIYTDGFENRALTGLFTGAFLFALLGFMDDIKNLSSVFRLIAQILISAAAVFLFTDDSLVLFNFIYLNGPILRIFQILWIVGLMNFYNFMDGIDGIAGVQAVFTSLSAALFLHLDILNHPEILPENTQNLFSDLRDIFLILISAVAGFLFWNRPKAKLFMGDSGSYFIGFILAFSALLVNTGSNGEFLSLKFRRTGIYNDFSLYVILLLPFIADPLTTLIKRFKNKMPLMTAHREHLYQVLLISGWKVMQIDILYLFFNFMFLLIILIFAFIKKAVLFFAFNAVAIAVFFLLIYFMNLHFTRKIKGAR